MGPEPRHQFPDHVAEYKNCTLLEQIREGASKAHRYGFRTEADVVRFIDLLWRISQDFDTSPDYPWASQILKDAMLSAGKKIELLRDAYAMHCAHHKAEAS